MTEPDPRVDPETGEIRETAHPQDIPKEESGEEATADGEPTTGEGGEEQSSEHPFENQ